MNSGSGRDDGGVRSAPFMIHDLTPRPGGRRKAYSGGDTRGRVVFCPAVPIFYSRGRSDRPPIFTDNWRTKRKAVVAARTRVPLSDGQDPCNLYPFFTARGAPPPLALARRLRASLGPQALLAVPCWASGRRSPGCRRKRHRCPDAVERFDVMQSTLDAPTGPADQGDADALFDTLYAELHRQARRELARQAPAAASGSRPCCTKPISRSPAAKGRSSPIARGSWPTPRA